MPAISRSPPVGVDDLPSTSPEGPVVDGPPLPRVSLWLLTGGRGAHGADWDPPLATLSVRPARLRTAPCSD